MTTSETTVAADPLARFVTLTKERRELEARVEEITQEQGRLQAMLLEEWADRGQQSANVDGLTVYVAHDFVCNKKTEVTMPELVNALTDNGLERYVQTGYNAASLKAWIKEQLAGESEIPAEVAKCLNWQTLCRLKTRLA